MEEKQYGFIYEPGTDQDYVLGGEVSLGGEVLMPNGHGWGNFLPEVEIQNANNIETYACTSFGTLSAFEILGRKYGLNFNFSDRHSAITSGTDPYVAKGNNPKAVIETARKQGLIPESDLPFSLDIDTVQKFYSPKPMRDPYIGSKVFTKL